MGLAYLTNWNVKYEMLASFAIACLISVTVYWLSRMTINSLAVRLALLIPVNLLIFSPAQSENWLWGFQIVIFIPVLCLFLSLVIARSNLALPSKAILAAVISTVSTYSFTHGMLCWATSLAALLLLEKRFLSRQGKRWLLFYIASGIVIISTYFYDYHKPEGHPSLAEAFIHPIQAFAYFTAFLGSPLSGGNLEVAIVSGSIGAALFCLLLIYHLINFKCSRSVYTSFNWIIVGLYALASALITTLGRVGFGVEQSLSSRYTTFSILLYISIIYLIVDIVYNSGLQEAFTKITQISHADAKNVFASLLSCFLTAIVVLHLIAFSPAIQAMQAAMRDHLYLKTCLTYVRFADDACKLRLFPDIPMLANRAEAVNAMGFLKPKLAESPVVRQAKTLKPLPKGTNGWFDQFSQTAPNQYMVRGWATLPDQNKSADAVLLTYTEEASQQNREWHLFAVAPVQQQRNDVVKAFKNSAYKISGWKTSFSTQALPKGQLRLRAWAYNTETNEAFKLGKTHLIQN